MTRRILRKPEQDPYTNDVEIGSFESKVRIDKHNLDGELQDQPDLYCQVAERFAHAESVRDMRKNDLKTVEAELWIEMRVKNEGDGKRFTEKDVAHMIQIAPERQTAFTRLVQAEKEVGLWQALKESYKDRGFMIRSLVELHLSSYFQNDSVSAATDMRRDFDAEKNRQKMAEMREQRAKRRS
jgi:hypothetical protein